MPEVPVDFQDYENEAAEYADLIADNKIAELAELDNESLKELLQEISTFDIDIELTGFDIDSLGNILAVQNEIIEDNFDLDNALNDVKEPISKLGDVWLLGKHRLLCGDSTSFNDFEKLMNGVMADMVFTDPPYGMFLNADYSDMDSKFKGSKGGKKYDNLKGDHEDFNPDLINTVFENFGYCKEIFLWGADYYAELLPKKNDGSWVVWDKRGDESADKMYGSTFELCWSKARHKRMIARVKWAGIFGLEKEHDKKRVHPTQKPVELIKWFFDYYSIQDKNKIVDLYAGSGSTLITGEKFNKQIYSMELDEKYVDVIVNRYKEFVGSAEDIKCIRDNKEFTYKEIFGEN